MFLASKLHKRMEQILPPQKFLGVEVPYTELSKMFNTLLKPYGIKARVARDDSMNKEKSAPFVFSGYFDTQKKRMPIVITLHVPSAKDAVKFNKVRYNYLMFSLSQIVQHEYIHKSQFTFRPEESEKRVSVMWDKNLPKEKIDQIDYLREWCEIEAYAHDIAMEIKFNYPDKKPEQVLKELDKHHKLWSYMFYKKPFRGVKWDKVKKSLVKKIWRWLPVAHIPPKYNG